MSDNFEQFKEEVDKLQHLVAEGENGCSTWHTMVHKRMKKLCFLYYGYEPSVIKPLDKDGK